MDFNNINFEGSDELKKDEPIDFESFEEPQKTDWIDFESSGEIVLPEISQKQKPKKPSRIIKPAIQTAKGLLYGEGLPAGLGYLQKPTEKAVDYLGQFFMTPKEEQSLIAKHPNLMAARYAAASVLLPGISEKFASPTEMKKFLKKSPEEQRFEITGLAAGYAAFGTITKGVVPVLAKHAVRKFPWLAKPIGKIIKDSNVFRRATIRERGIIVQSTDDMVNAGLSEAQILQSLRKSGNVKEFRKFKAEAIQKRMKTEVPIEPIKPKVDEPIITEPLKPTVKPTTELGRKLQAAMQAEKRPPVIADLAKHELEIKESVTPTPMTTISEEITNLVSVKPLPAPMRAFGMREKPIEPIPTEPTAEITREPVGVENLNPDLAKKVKYEGIQTKAVKLSTGEITEEPAFHTFTDKKTHSTFIVPFEKDINIGVSEHLKELEQKAEMAKKEVVVEKVEKPIEIKKGWKVTPSDENEAWGQMMKHVEAVKAENADAIDDLNNELKILKSSRKKEDVVRKKEIKKEIITLKAKHENLEANYENDMVEAGMAFVDEARDQAKQIGVPEDVLDDFAEDFSMQISQERPYIETNYNKTRKQIFDEVIEDYLPESVAKPQPPKLPKAKPPEAVREEIKGEVIPEVKSKVEKEKVEVTPEPMSDIAEPPKKPTERIKPLFTETQIKRRKKQKAIKQQQLQIENAKQAKEQIHEMIRKRRQNLNLSAYETNLFVNDIEKITTRSQRETIPFIIEGTEIPKGLKRPDLEKILANDIEKLTPIAKQVKEHFDKGWRKIKENTPDMSAEQIENYVTHIWDIPKSKKQTVTNWFATQNRFLKKRYIETINEGIEKFGLEPKVLDIGEIIRIHDGITSRVIENNKFVEQLKNLKYEGVSLIERADKAPQDWIYFDHPALRRGLVIPGKTKMGEKVSPELANLLTEMGVAIGRRISPVTFGKPTAISGQYKSGELPEVRFQRFMSNRTIAHEIGHHLDSVLGLGKSFLEKYKTELYAINKERIESFIGKPGKYGEEYARSYEEQIAEFFATLFTKSEKTYKIAPNATADVLNRLKQDGTLSRLIDFDFEKQAKNLIEEQMNTLIKLPVKVHPDIVKPLKVIFDSRFDHEILQAYESVNGILKKTNLSLSLFHHGALGETGIAIMGFIKTAGIYFNPVKIYKALVKGKFPVYEKKAIARDSIKNGLQVGATADIPVNMIQRKLNELARKTKNIPLLNKTTELIRTFNQTWDKALWDYLHDTLKIYAYESLVSKVDLKKDVKKQKQEIAQFINDTFGGQNWDTLMVTPKTLQIMTWSLLSADWTTSTIRQALSPTGIGKVHKETTGLRKKMGWHFWIKAGLYFGVGINLLNYTFRKWDEEKNSQYYEGIERDFIDRTMIGNSLGHKTHLFVGRYEDGSERYIRWGKQFRELPELFFDDTGFSPISATLKKIGGKLAPVLQLASRITTGTSLSGFRDDDVYGKKGWDRVLGIGKTLIKSPLPFASRALFQEGKEFHITDITMPSSKGMTRYKSIELFKYAIKHQDEQFLKETYQFTLMNNLPAYTLFKAGLTSLKAESTKEYNEGIDTLDEAMELLIETENVADLKRIKRTINRIQKEQIDRKLGMDLLEKAILDMELYELIESESSNKTSLKSLIPGMVPWKIKRKSQHGESQ